MAKARADAIAELGLVPDATDQDLVMARLIAQCARNEEIMAEMVAKAAGSDEFLARLAERCRQDELALMEGRWLRPGGARTGDEGSPLVVARRGLSPA
jgi:hypothetical protein